MKSNMPNPSDKLTLELWNRTKQGEWDAFGQLAENHYRSLYNYATNFTQDADLIKDTIQDLYLHLWEKRESIQIEQITFYMLRAIRNNLFYSFRSLKSNQAALKEYITGEPAYTPAEIELISKETEYSQTLQLTEAIERLPKRQKEIVFLKYYQGMDNEQIASLLEVNRQSIANLVYKALTNLRQQIPDSYWVIVAAPFI
jgi:RNA polymerase sigma factor (sigma-70 family)